MTVNPEKQSLHYQLSWGRWLDQWELADEYHLCTGLLHCGFDTKAENRTEEAERICFYLKLADGYSDEPFYQGGLRRKAFECLSHHFFSQQPVYVAVLPPDVLTTLLWFFRPDEKKYPEEGGGLHNLRSSRSEDKEDKAGERAMRFLTELTMQIWHDLLKSDRWRLNNETLKLAPTTKPQFIEIIHAARGQHLTALVRHPEVFGRPAHWDPFDEASLNKLKEVALMQKGWFANGHRQVASIEEAVYLGSSAAQLYLMCTIAQREEKRFVAIRETQEKIREGKQTLERLTGTSR